MDISRIIPFKIVSVESVEKASRASVREAELITKIEKLENQVAELTEDNSVLLKEKQDSIYKVIDVGIGDPAPVDSKQRALYVATVAGLHKDILEPKLKLMIAILHKMLSESSNDREYDQALKGAIYFAWELIGWGNRMVNEQIAVQQGDHPELSES